MFYKQIKIPFKLVKKQIIFYLGIIFNNNNNSFTIRVKLDMYWFYDN